MEGWVKEQVPIFSEEGIKKLVPHYNKHLYNGGNYVENEVRLNVIHGTNKICF